MLVTGCGYPDIATRALVSKLSSKCAVGEGEWVGISIM